MAAVATVRNLTDEAASVQENRFMEMSGLGF